VLLVFPEGTRSRTGEVGQARPGVAFIACAGGATVVPAAISGSHELGRALLRRRRVGVAFGEPFAAGTARSRADYDALTDRIMRDIGALAEELERP
jgi:1-acyl-sn-glycerol-3-phosphate acyltransferase